MATASFGPSGAKFVGRRRVQGVYACPQKTPQRFDGFSFNHFMFAEGL